MDLTVLTVHLGTLLWTFPLMAECVAEHFPFVFVKNIKKKKKKNLTSDLC